LSGNEQGLGGLLIRKIEGDYHNVVGFPAASFFRFLDLLVEEDDDFLEVWNKESEGSMAPFRWAQVMLAVNLYHSKRGN
jgi:hypothetical protein